MKKEYLSKVFALVFSALMILSSGLTGCSADASSSENPAPAPEGGETTYTVSFDVNGGTEDNEKFAPQTVKEGEKARNPGSPAKEHFHASNGTSGWSTVKNDKDSEFNFDTAIDADKVLYALWDIDQHTVSFDLNGATGISPEAQKADWNTEITLPSVDGFTKEVDGKPATCLGWAASADAESGSSGNVNVTEDVTYYLAWTTKDVFEVTFKVGGETYNTAKVVEGKTVEAPNAPSKDGYTFKEWQLNGSAYDFSSSVNSSIELTAVWDLVEYSITYNDEKNGDVESGLKVSTYTIESAEITLPELTKDGYTFNGWKKDGESVTSIPAGSFGDITLTADWTIIEYTITYALNGGTNATSNPDTYTVESDTIEFAPATKERYAFDKWEPASIANGSTGNVEVTASWKEVAVESVRITGSSSVRLGKTVQLKAVVTPSNATATQVTWKATGAATVDSNGLVTAGDTEGTASVTATVGGVTSPVFTVNVTDKPAVTAWNFASWSSESKTNIDTDAAWVKNSDGTNRYKMNVDGEAVANGTVIKELEGITFDKAAAVLISWDSSKGSYLQTSTSMEIPVEAGYEITFSASNTGSSNGTRKLVVTENGVSTTVLSSGNTTKATGKYTPKAGTSSITVSFPDGGMNVYSIKGPVHATGLSLAIDGINSVTLKEGVARDITATITPSDAAEKEITWTSDKPEIVKVENGKITPLAVSGETVTITAELSNGVSATFTVNGVSEAVKPTSINVTYANETSLEKLVVGYSKTLAVSYNPENVEAKALIWSSSNPEAVSVIDGVIKGLAKADSAVTITATTVNGKTATFVINTVVDPSEVTDTLVITKEGGWFRSVYAEWIPSSNVAVTGYNAYVVKGTDKTKIDKELIRKYSDHYRVDALGLSAGDYQIKVVAVIGSEESEIAGMTGTVKAVADDRQGFAFKNGAEPGAYKADGTLKEGTTVVYVTEANKKTVTAKIGNTTYTGIAAITQAVKTKNNAQPFDFRIVGMVTLDGLVCADLNSAYAMGVKTAENVTIEGVGEDATFNGVGLAAFEESNNIEFCNIALYDWGDDGISLKNTSHAWIHNCDIFYGHPGNASDQVKGDGSMDLKDDSKYVTISYMHFYDSGKMSLCGMKSESGSNWIDYHHNWFDHSDSRHPRIRTMSVHVWNNYYDGNSKYGVGTAKDSEAFVENNYFRGTKYPMMSSQQGTDALGDGTFSGENGGVIKSFNNYMVGHASYITFQQNSSSFDAYEAATRNEQVPAAAAAKVGGKVYTNFDTNSTYMHGPYTPDVTMQVPDIVMGKVQGRIGAGRMNGGDLHWTFTSADDASHDIDAALKAYVFNYVSPVKETYATASSVYYIDGSYAGGNPTDPTDPATPSDPVAVTGVTLDKTTADVTVGGTVKLTATLTPSNATNTTVNWASSDTNIASVSKGTVTGKAAGTATITVTTADGGFTATCVVTVTKPAITLPATAVSAGTVNLTTKGDKALTGQSAGASQTSDNVLVTSKIDSAGANIYGTKAGAADPTKGGIYFKLDSTMTVSFTYNTDNGVQVFKVDANGDASSTAESSMTLAAGTYVVYGKSASATKITAITFTN